MRTKCVMDVLANGLNCALYRDAFLSFPIPPYPKATNSNQSQQTTNNQFALDDGGEANRGKREKMGGNAGNGGKGRKLGEIGGNGNWNTRHAF